MSALIENITLATIRAAAHKKRPEAALVTPASGLTSNDLGRIVMAPNPHAPTVLRVQARMVAA
jgi:hypothetical protein